MKRSKMLLIVVLMCTAICAVVILQSSWLINSYAVSKEKNEAEVKALLDLAIAEQKRLTADTVRMLMKKVVRSEKDFTYRIFHNWNGGTKIGFRSANQNTYALYAITAKDTILLKKDPYGFLLKKMNTLTLDELDPLYTTLVGVNDYIENTAERATQIRLSTSFSPSKDMAVLKRILTKCFSDQGMDFNGRVRLFKDMRDIYGIPVSNIKTESEKTSLSSEMSIGVLFGSDKGTSLEVQLKSLTTYTDSLNRNSDSTFAAKPLLHDVTNIMHGQIPTILLSVDTPYTLIARKMSAGILGSFALMIFIALCVIYLYKTIVKQKQLSEIKNDFISNISHELKTPIATAQAAVQGLKFVGQNPEKTDSYLNTASSEIQRLSVMVDKILNISLLESKDFHLSPEHFNFETMLKGIVAAQQVRKEKPVTIALHYDAKPEIFADKTQLYEVMINLIDNAIKYSGSQVHIDITCTDAVNGIEIAVGDNGNGIPAEFREHIFDKFFRVPDVHNHAIKGYGLGLNYAKTIVEKHRGSIQLSESEDYKTLFLIKLPQP